MVCLPWKRELQNRVFAWPTTPTEHLPLCWAGLTQKPNIKSGILVVPLFLNRSNVATPMNMARTTTKDTHIAIEELCS